MKMLCLTMMVALLIACASNTSNGSARDGDDAGEGAAGGTALGMPIFKGIFD